MFTKRRSKHSKKIIDSKAVTRKRFINKGGRIGYSNSFSTYSNPPPGMMSAADRRSNKFNAQNNFNKDLQYKRFLDNNSKRNGNQFLATRYYAENKARQNMLAPSRTSNNSMTISRYRGGKKTIKRFHK